MGVSEFGLGLDLGLGVSMEWMWELVLLYNGFDLGGFGDLAPVNCFLLLLLLLLLLFFGFEVREE